MPVSRLDDRQLGNNILRGFQIRASSVAVLYSSFFPAIQLCRTPPIRNARPCETTGGIHHYEPRPSCAQGTQTTLRCLSSMWLARGSHQGASTRAQTSERAENLWSHLSGVLRSTPGPEWGGGARRERRPSATQHHQEQRRGLIAGRCTSRGSARLRATDPGFDPYVHRGEVMITPGQRLARCDSNSQMLRYAGAVAASKILSTSDSTKRLYRFAGNKILERQRLKSAIPSRYIERAQSLVRTCLTHDAVHDGDKVLELGSGYVHWEATIVRLLCDVEVTLFDVWDDRLFKVWQQWLHELGDQVESLGLPSERRKVAHDLLLDSREARSLDDMYALLNFRYVQDSSGLPDSLEHDAYSLAVSADVLEHVDRGLLPRFLSSVRTVLRPGGLAINQIDLVDHYSYFDPSTSPKAYYRFSDRVWRHLQSSVQYFNRVQRPQWLAFFEQAGLLIVDEQVISEPLRPMHLAAPYRDMALSDLRCMQIRTVHRRPPDVA
jgi:SAM-dependent methyltransferase